MADATDDELVRRALHRWAGYLAVRRSQDCIDAYAFFGPSLLPDPPNAFRVITISKRSWEKRMAAWRHELQMLNHVVRPVMLQTGALD